jgi:hypothetical protein
MKVEAQVVVVAQGAHGPFKEDGKPDRFYPFVELAAADGSGTRRATLAENVASWTPPLFTPIRVQLELHGTEKMKLRCHGPLEDAKPAIKAA